MSVRRIAILALWAAAAPHPARAQEASRAVSLRPGDVVFEHLDRLRVVSYPSANLPPDLDAALRKPFKTLLPRVDSKAWALSPRLPDDLQARLGATTRLRHWTAAPGIVPAADAGPPRVLVGNREAAGRFAVSATAAGPFVWWDGATRTLQAVSEIAPAGVGVEYVADPAGELGEWELRLRSGSDAPPAAADLVRRVERSNVTRTALLLPAGGALALSADEIRADALRVAVALENVGWKAVGGRIQRVPRRSDGAVVAIDAFESGRRRRLWSRRIEPSEAGSGFIEARAPLKDLAGRGVELRLVTEPGPAGDAAFDYVLWGDLTFEGAPAAPPARPHVILIDIDTLRADSLSMHGSRNPTSPYFDRWATRRATIFENSEATASWTLPSTMSILTGTWVQQHGVHNEGTARSGSAIPLPVLLRAAGYETWGLVDGGWLLPAFGFAEGFDRFECAFRQDMNWESAIRWLRSRRSERPVFLFLHTYLVHAPYPCDVRFEAGRERYDGPLQGKPIDVEGVLNPASHGVKKLTPREIEYVRNLYDAGVARMDETLGRFLIDLERALGGDDWMLVFTSDHGEAFLEHGMMGHGTQLHGELVRVPLVVRWPQSATGAPPVGFHSAPVSSVDIVPTVLESVGLEIPEHLPGRSLLSRADESRPRLAFSDEQHQSITHEGFRLIRRGPAESPKFELYDLASDPHERTNLAAADADRVARMNDLLERICRRYPRMERRDEGEGALDAEALAALRALGYLR